MSLLRFKVFQSIFFKTATFFSIVMSAFLYAGNAYSADVTLAWDGVSQSGVSVTGYRVYYGTQNGSYPTRGCQVADTSCTVKELKDGQTYHFVARAYNSYGESGNSDPVSYTVNDASAGTTSNVSNTGSFSSDNSSDLIADLDPSPTAIAFEAEDGIVKNSMVTAADQNAYSGRYILIPNGIGSDGYATYTFQVTSPGNYVVWGRVLASNGKSDSFFVSMDGNADSLWDVVQSTSWTWDKVNNRNGADPVVYNLAAGTHTLIIKQREMETKLDGIVISKDIDTVPSTSCFNGSSSTTTSSSSSTNSGSVPSDPTSAGDATGSSSNSDSTDSTTATNPSGSS
ncbi:MAG: fibronectin type III domain-containing protein, partial [Desulfobacterales bacterium]